MTRYPKISIAVAVYGVEPYIEECLNSLVQQTYKNIEIIIDGNIIRVNYNKPKDEDPRDFVLKGIAQRSFNLGWKIDSKFELRKAKADFVNGLLRVSIPYAKGMETKTLKIS